MTTQEKQEKAAHSANHNMFSLYAIRGSRKFSRGGGGGGGGVQRIGDVLGGFMPRFQIP